MTDLWGFLLQTLTASGAAAMLLVVKAMFRDKLPPRWQFAAWGVLGLVLLLPAGLGGRYALLNWPWLVETVKTIFSGDYSLTRVLAPIPLPRLRVPSTAAEWLYAVYVLGALALLIRYAVVYIRLRRALLRGAPAGEARTARIAAVAEKYARAPGTSSMANGGKNIQRRIESIARFKRYPAGMALVSACAAVTLADHSDGPADCHGDLDRGQGLAGRAVGLYFSSLGGGVHRRGPVPDGGAVRAAEILPGGPAVTGGKKLKKRGCKRMLLQPRFFNCFIAGWTRRNFINRQSYVA